MTYYDLAAFLLLRLRCRSLRKLVHGIFQRLVDIGLRVFGVVYFIMLHCLHGTRVQSEQGGTRDDVCMSSSGSSL